MPGADMAFEGTSPEELRRYGVQYQDQEGQNPLFLITSYSLLAVLSFLLHTCPGPGEGDGLRAVPTWAVLRQRRPRFRYGYAHTLVGPRGIATLLRIARPCPVPT